MSSNEQLTRQLIDTVERYGAHNYHPLPIVLRKGKGAKVWDVEGKEYLDFLACYSALNFGHQHPDLVNALKKQLDEIAVTSRAFFAEELCYFSKELADLCGLEVVLAMNTGTEGVETALKLARKWGYEKKKVAPEKANIIAMQNNFHGRTIAVVSFSSEGLYRDGFGPYTPGFKTVPYDDVTAVEAAIDANTVAVLLEPIQAEAGILIPQTGYLKKLRDLCTKKNVLLMLDEIQTGMARTGKNFCYEYEGIRPDVVILGKSLGGGLLPLSAVVSTHDVMDVIKPGQHGSTFGGNPLACAVGRKAIAMLKTGEWSARANKIGDLVLQAVKAVKLPVVKEARGRGALIGIELDPKAGGARRYTEILAKQGVLCKETHDHVIRIAPPLVIPESELASGVEKIIQVIKNT